MNALLKSLGAFTAPGTVPPPGSGLGTTNLLGGKSGLEGGANALERIGFGSGSSSSEIVNYSRRTADNTQQIVRGQVNIINGIATLVDRWGNGFVIANK